MSKLKFLYQKYTKTCWVSGAIILLIVFAVFFGGKNGDKNIEEYIVSKGNIEQAVSLSGKVETSDRADLGFAASGRIASIFVDNNELVVKGQMLAQLEVADLLADLRIKEANLKTSDIDLEAAKDELDNVIIQENTKVANAYRTMLSEDLELIPSSDTYNIEPPTIKGVYDGLEGQYKVSINYQNSFFDKYELRTFNLEKTQVKINETGSTALGTHGLYISFDENPIGDYESTTWYLSIPNKTSSSYLANYNAYMEAKNARDLAIKDAQATYDKLRTEDNNGSSVALAEIQKIEAEINKNTIYAPFKGKVTNIEKEVGESAGVGERVVSILGEQNLEVVLQVSELDVSRLFPTQEIEIKLDAFPNEVFQGILKTVNSKETEIDGVPVYEAFVSLNFDSRIKAGMSATGFVVLDERQDVLMIPAYFVKKEGDTKYVLVALGEKDRTKKEVVTGLLGSDSMIEIISGLSEGEKIISIKE